LQSKLGKKVSFDEAIRVSLQEEKETDTARQKFESLYGSLSNRKDIWKDLENSKKADRITLLGEDLGDVVRSTGILPSKGKTLYCSRSTIAESFYILCGKDGKEYAEQSIQTLLASKYLSLLDSDELDMMAGGYKCSRSLSLADCYVLAVAKLKGIPAVFARREEDLEKELHKKPFDVRLAFLEDQM
jgi:predicted nucleic acid-binding protein